MFNLPIPPMPVPGMGPTAAIGVPVGTIVAFAGQIASTPSNSSSFPAIDIEALGWLICDGRQVKISEYPELFAVLGYLYGQGKMDEKDDPSQFKIPDCRGLFLRGVDDSAAQGSANNDPDKSKRKPPNEKEGYGVASRQEDALQTHQHQYNKVPQNQTLIQPEKGAPAIAPLPQPDLTGEATDSLSAPGNVRSSSETRPKNVAVNYIIKYING